MTHDQLNAKVMKIHDLLDYVSSHVEEARRSLEYPPLEDEPFDRDFIYPAAAKLVCSHARLEKAMDELAALYDELPRT